VAASLLRAVGLPELVAPTLADYERIAIELGRDAGARAALRARLAENRLTMPLFRTEPYARELEAAYLAMHERRLRGAAPEAFAV
jgi:predicted O-linked N-acetylglucosamine transferase (SPINDLY family)